MKTWQTSAHGEKGERDVCLSVSASLLCHPRIPSTLSILPIFFFNLCSQLLFIGSKIPRSRSARVGKGHSPVCAFRESLNYCCYILTDFS